jgi:serine/threonine protein kinase
MGDADSDEQLKRRALLCLTNICGRRGILPDSYIISYSPDLSNNTPIASGGFGAVYRDVYNGIVVAVKVFKVWANHIPEKLKQVHFLVSICVSVGLLAQMFCQEAVAWKLLSHENVVPFLGASFSPTTVSLVSIWMEHGNINEYIRERPDCNRLQLVSYLQQSYFRELISSRSLIADRCCNRCSIYPFKISYPWGFERSASAPVFLAAFDLNKTRRTS